MPMSQPLVAALSLEHILAWPDGLPVTVAGLPTPALSTNVLALLDAANRAETTAALQATATKLNEVIALLNAARS